MFSVHEVTNLNVNIVFGFFCFFLLIYVFLNLKRQVCEKVKLFQRVFPEVFSKEPGIILVCCNK